MHSEDSVSMLSLKCPRDELLGLEKKMHQEINWDLDALAWYAWTYLESQGQPLNDFTSLLGRGVDRILDSRPQCHYKRLVCVPEKEEI